MSGQVELGFEDRMFGMFILCMFILGILPVVAIGGGGDLMVLTLKLMGDHNARAQIWGWLTNYQHHPNHTTTATFNNVAPIYYLCDLWLFILYFVGEGVNALFQAFKEALS